MTVDAGAGGVAGREAEYGEAEEERLMNARVRLVEGFVRVDPFGDGQARTCEYGAGDESGAGGGFA